MAPFRSKWRMQLARERENRPASKRGSSKIPRFQRGRGVLLPIIFCRANVGCLGLLSYCTKCSSSASETQQDRAGPYRAGSRVQRCLLVQGQRCHRAGSWSACLLVRLLRKAELPHIKPNYFIPSPISPAIASEIFPRPVSGWMTPYDPKTTYGAVPCSGLLLCLYAMTLCRIDWHIFYRVLQRWRASPTSKSGHRRT